MKSDKVVREFIQANTWLSMKESKVKLPKTPGVYVVRSGTHISHIGKSNNVDTRVSQLIELRAHRASARVLCFAFCTRKPPEICCETISSSVKRTIREKELKQLLVKQRTPGSKYNSCKDGQVLRNELKKKATDWQRGYIDAVFDIREFLRNLFRPRFEPLWKNVGKPPGWENFSIENHRSDG